MSIIYCLKGDIVKTKSGDTGEVMDIWGVARVWLKIKTDDGRLLYLMSDQVESIIKREQGRKKKWRSR